MRLLSNFFSQMKKYFSLIGLSLSGLNALMWITSLKPIYGQITSDGTLPNPTLVKTLDQKHFTISEGSTVGSNLFHSFRRFSVPQNGAANFDNMATVQNIIGRITGGEISNIDGIISSNGKANLFLLNPNGFIFGPNAALNIGGSFLSSTANSMRFQDGTELEANANQVLPLLTSTVPIGLNFRGEVKGTIVNQANLAVKPGNTLALVGGDIIFNSGQATAESGRIEIGSVNTGIVNLAPIDVGWRLGYDQVQTFHDIQFFSQSAVTNPNFVSNSHGGIQVQGNRITLSQSQIVAQTLGIQKGAEYPYSRS